MNCRRLYAALFLFLSCAFSGCAAWGRNKLETREIALENAAESVPIKAEIAKTDEERSRGLMYRKNLADGEGMLFVFEKDELLSFWMKNTLIPLSIAFISSEGRIMEIHDMEPGNLDPVHSGRSVRYALEVPQGWFSRVNLQVGDKLVINKPF